MSLATQVVALASRVGAEFKTLNAKVDKVRTDSNIVLNKTDTAPPVGTPANTVVFRKKV